MFHLVVTAALNSQSLCMSMIQEFIPTFPAKTTKDSSMLKMSRIIMGTKLMEAQSSLLMDVNSALQQNQMNTVLLTPTSLEPIILTALQHQQLYHQPPQLAHQNHHTQNKLVWLHISSWPIETSLVRFWNITHASKYRETSNFSHFQLSGSLPSLSQQNLPKMFRRL